MILQARRTRKTYSLDQKKAAIEEIIRTKISCRQYALTHGMSQQTILTWYSQLKDLFIKTDSKKLRPEAWNKDQKRSAVLDTASMLPANLDEYLIAKGLSINDLNTWRQEFKNELTDLTTTNFPTLQSLTTTMPTKLISNNMALAQENEHLRKQVTFLQKTVLTLEEELESLITLLDLKIKSSIRKRTALDIHGQ